MHVITKRADFVDSTDTVTIANGWTLSLTLQPSFFLPPPGPLVLLPR